MKYITVMFPYPSGSGLHIGHWYNYSIVDSYCKIQKFLGKEVFQPFGYDSFGLPAENYARLIGGDVKEITENNINNFQKEIERMNTSFEYLLSTHEENYQTATEYLFSLLLEKGLAYKANREQDYCPSCETVLAREQVKDGICERCKTQIEKKTLNQWFLKITDYKERLIKDLDKVDYPEKTKKQQKEWLNNLTDWCVSRQRGWGCPIPIEGETDTLDTFVDSSFYTIEYCKRKQIKPIPVDMYVGGNEHACMHLIYARFICKFLYDIGEIDFDEPFKKVIHQGMILGEDGNKMSKSLGNVINPKNYESQALKIHLMFINHYFQGGKFDENQFKGCVKFINKIKNWTINHTSEISKEEEQNFINRVVNYFEEWKTNKVVSEWMIFYNKNKYKQPSKELIEFFNICF
jgi:leucyl-tRNA synthetase